MAWRGSSARCRGERLDGGVNGSDAWLDHLNEVVDQMGQRMDARVSKVDERIGGGQQQTAQFALALVVAIVLGFAGVIVALLIGLG